MASSPLPKLAKQASALERALSAPAPGDIMKMVGGKFVSIAAAQVAADIGDNSMSHWRRGSPTPIVAQAKVDKSTVTAQPTPRSRGPWRVLTDGRRGGAATDLMLVGRVRKKGKNAGTRRGRARGRNSGNTAGGGTWTRVEAAMNQVAPVIVEKNTKAAVSKALRGQL